MTPCPNCGAALAFKRWRKNSIQRQRVLLRRDNYNRKHKRCLLF